MKKIFDIITKKLKYSNNVGFIIAIILIKIKVFVRHRLWRSDKKAIQSQFKAKQGYELNLSNPNTLNEKIQYLKLYGRKPVQTILADKYAVREYMAKNYGKELLIDLMFYTDNWKNIIKSNMPDIPFIIKPNHASGWYHIINCKDDVNWNKIKTDCRFWLSWDYSIFQKEWQYSKIPRKIIVEKLLIQANGGLPNNYRLHCMSGNVEVISVNLFQGNTKSFTAKKFDKSWNTLDFKFGVESSNIIKDIVPKPKNLSKMIKIAEDIAKQFPYVRVDFYDVDEKLYFGEITFQDSGGYDKISPFEWDIKLGSKINLDFGK